jgi:hypothetical protein
MGTCRGEISQSFRFGVSAVLLLQCPRRYGRNRPASSWRMGAWRLVSSIRSSILCCDCRGWYTRTIPLNVPTISLSARVLPSLSMLATHRQPRSHSSVPSGRADHHSRALNRDILQQ